MDEDIKIWRCTVCGWPHEGENPPNNCPRCGVPAEKFELVDLSLLDLEDEDEAAMVDVKELTEADKKRIRSALYRISYGLYVVGSCQEDKINAQICNTVFQITNTPMRVAIGLNKNTLTHEYVKHSGVFTVCILGKEHMDLIGTFGFKSGRDIDKFANVPHHIGVTGAPLVDGCVAFVECKVDPALTVDVGTHTLLIGDVIEGNTNDGDPMTYAMYRQLKKGGLQTGPVPEAVQASPADEGNGKAKTWRCEVCGYIHEGETPPDECPVCGVSKERFVLVE